MLPDMYNIFFHTRGSINSITQWATHQQKISWASSISYVQIGRALVLRSQFRIRFGGILNLVSPSVLHIDWVRCRSVGFIPDSPNTQTSPLHIRYVYIKYFEFIMKVFLRFRVSIWDQVKILLLGPRSGARSLTWIQIWGKTLTPFSEIRIGRLLFGPNIGSSWV